MEEGKQAPPWWLMRNVEETHQIALVTWFDISYPNLSKISPKGKRISLLWATPNGGKRNLLEAIRLKKQGVRAGVPDLFLAVPRGTFHGFFIEMKAGKNKLTESQEAYFEILREQQYKIEVAYDWMRAADMIRDYLNEPRAY